MDHKALEEAGKALAAKTSIRRWEDEAPADKEDYIDTARTAVATYLSTFSGNSADLIAKMRETIAICPTKETGDLLATLADHYEADVFNLATQLDAERQENERLRAIVEGRFADASKLRLKSAAPCQDGTFDINIQGEIIPLIAAHLAEEFKALGGENYVQMQFSAPETGPLVLSVQRLFGKLPAQVASEAVKRAETAEAKLVGVMNLANAAVELEKAVRSNDALRANAADLPEWKAVDEAIRNLPADFADFAAPFSGDVAELLASLQAWVDSFNDDHLVTCTVQHITQVNGYSPADDVEKAINAIRSLHSKAERLETERDVVSTALETSEDIRKGLEDRLAALVPVVAAASNFESDIRNCDPKHLEYWDCFNAYIGEGGELTDVLAAAAMKLTNGEKD